MLRLRPLLILAAGFVPFVGGLQSAEPALPARPASHVYDDARVFSPEQIQKLESQLANAHQQVGASIDIATFTYITGGNTNQLAQTLATTWQGSEPGLILVFNRGTSQPAIAVSPGMWQKYPADDVTLAALRVSNVFSQGPPVPDERMMAATEFALAEISQLEKNRLARQQVFTADDRTLAIIVAVTLVIFGSAAILLSRRLRRRRDEVAETFTFPEVHVGLRLGAPFGGGKGVEVSGNDPPPHA
ncbi:MAG: TPM domain-containing protein [Verrucomicrobium sp.]|nr:TPM domain-containing protein [Verrucomicrobium sp.]